MARKLLLASAVWLMGSTVALAQTPAYNPAASHNQEFARLIGRDTGTGTICTLGTTSTCQIPVTATITGGDASAANQVITNTALGTTASTACATSASTCDVIATLKGILAGVQGTGPTTTGNLSATLAMTTATTTKIITGVSAKLTYVTGMGISSSAAATVSLVSGTGSNCGTGTATLWQTDLPAGAGLQQGTGIGNLIAGVAASTDVCVTVSASSNVKTNLAYVQQ